MVLRCGDYIRRSDLLLYANILADSYERAQELKGYMACVAASLAGQDAELIPEILHRVDFEQEDPGEALSRLWDECSIPCPNQRPGEQELQMRVWVAQLQSAFSLIELERLRIAEEYGDLIEDALNTEHWESKWDRTGFIRQRNDELDSTSDVELDTLVRMMSLRRNDDRTQPLLSFPDHEMQSRIIFLTECQNNLAHHRVCAPGQMYGLLSFIKDAVRIFKLGHLLHLGAVQQVAPLVDLHKGADDIDADDGLAPDPQDGDFSPGDQLPQRVPANAGTVSGFVYRHAEFPSPEGLHSQSAPAVRQ